MAFKPKFVSELTAYYTDAIAADIRDPQKSGFRSVELHPSSFPYCGVRHFHNICQEPPTADRDIPHSMSFYVSIGTAFHTAIQAAMARGMQVYGNWTCLECGFTKKFSRKPTCPKCHNKHMRYDELGVRYGRRIVGHVDGVWIWKDKKKYYLIDYKSAGVSSFEYHEKTGKGFPKPANVEQIIKYIVLIEAEYDIELSGWALIYQARDKFDKFEIVGATVSDDEKRKHRIEVKRWDRHHDIVVRAKSLEDIQVVIEEKPCKSYDDYMNRYHDKFNECPLYQHCFKRSSLKLQLESDIAGVDWLPLTEKTLEEEYAAARTK